MDRVFTANDRKSLIRLASEMPKGSKERRAILAGLTKSAYGLGWEKLGDAERENGAAVFSEQEKKKAIEMAKAFASWGETAAEASKASYSKREAGEDVPYWQNLGGFFVPAPTSKQGKWKWLNDAMRVTPGKLKLVIRAVDSPFAVAVMGVGRINGEPVREVYWESVRGASDKIMKAR